MTDQEAYEGWKAQPLNRLSVSPEQAWHAALAWLRSQGEPVASLLRTNSNQIECFYRGTLCPIDGHHFHKEFVEAIPIGKAVLLYLAPQPAIPNRVVNAISVVVADAMAQAVANGANSISMPDEYVEIALWLSKLPDDTDPQPAIPDGGQSKASRDVLAERRRQVEAEGWTPEHDDAHGDGSMCIAAVCYAEWDHYERPNSDGLIPINWPWSAKWWKPRDRRRNLVKAAALLLAEIERLDRTSTAAPEPRK